MKTNSIKALALRSVEDSQSLNMRAILLLGLLAVVLTLSDGYGYGGRPELATDAKVQKDSEVSAEANANAQSSVNLNTGINLSGSAADEINSQNVKTTGHTKQTEAGIAVSADVASGADALITLLNAAGEVAKNVAANLKKQAELGGQVQLQAGAEQAAHYDAAAQANLASQLEKLAALEAAVGLSSGQGKIADSADSESAATVHSAGAAVTAHHEHQHEGGAQFGIGGGLGGLLGLGLGVQGAHEHRGSYSGQVSSNSNANAAVDGSADGKVGLGLNAGLGGNSGLSVEHKGSVGYSENAAGGTLSSSGSIEANTGLHRVKLEKDFSSEGGLGLGLGLQVGGGKDVKIAAEKEDGRLITLGHDSVQLGANCGVDSCSFKPKGERGTYGNAAQGNAGQSLNVGLGATANANANSGSSNNANSEHGIGHTGSLDSSAGLGVELGVSVNGDSHIAKDSHGHVAANVGKVDGQLSGGYAGASAQSSGHAAGGAGGSVNVGTATDLNGGLGIGLDIKGALEVLKSVANAVHATAHHSSMNGEASLGVSADSGRVHVYENAKADVPSFIITDHADGTVVTHAYGANGHEASANAEAGLGLGLGGGLGLGLDVGAKKTLTIGADGSANIGGSSNVNVEAEAAKSSTTPASPAFHYNDGLGVGIDLAAKKKVEKSGYGSASAGLGLGLGSVLSLG